MKKISYNFKKDIEKQIEESITLKRKIKSEQTNIINEIAIRIIYAYKEGKKILWFGNGGSAADAQHLSCELIGKFRLDRKPLSSIALTTNTSILTAVSNDTRFENIFERQIEGLAEKGDILIGITTSGISPNIIKGLKIGKKIGTVNIVFTGRKIELVQKFADYIIAVPSSDTPRIQETHIMVGHIICELVEKSLFGE